MMMASQRAELRRYCLGRLERAGDRFDDHGTGRELYLGFLRVLPGLLLAVAAPLALYGFARDEALRLTGLLAAHGAVLACLPAVIALSWRNRVSRTSWRGVRFSWHESLGEGYAEPIRGFLLTVITLRIGYPLLQARLRRAPPLDEPRRRRSLPATDPERDPLHPDAGTGRPVTAVGS